MTVSLAPPTEDQRVQAEMMQSAPSYVSPTARGASRVGLLGRGSARVPDDANASVFSLDGVGGSYFYVLTYK